MPLVSLSGADAFANLKANRKSLWPDGRKDHTRLDGVAKVSFKPSFTLSPGEAVFTMGSCFARNIERRFSEAGFEVPTMALALPPEERASDTDNDLLNKYPPHSILNELRWALDPEVTFPEAGFFHIRKDLWHDPHLAGNVAYAPLERVRERRRMVEDIYRQVPRCRLVVMTLGLVEAWYDLETGYYLNGAPPASAFNDSPGRFRLDVMTVDEVVQALEDIHQVLTRFGAPDFRMMLTVSPVPFKATFSGHDALIANTYSKSALRVAAEVFVLRHSNVDYVPSYEIVTHTPRNSAFIQDNRHVTPSVVNEIVDRVVSTYCPSEDDENARESETHVSRGRLRDLLKSGDFSGAVAIYSKLERGQRYLRWGYSEFDYRLAYAKALGKLESHAEAQAQLSKAVELQPDDSGANFNLGLVLAKLQRPLEAEEHMRRAAEMDDTSVEIRLRLAQQLISNGKRDEAISQLQVAAQLDPKHRRVRALLNDLLTGDKPAAPTGAAEPLVAVVAPTAPSPPIDNPQKRSFWSRITTRA